MKIRMKRTDEVRVKPARVRVYREGVTYTVTKAVGEDFIEKGSAEPITDEQES